MPGAPARAQLVWHEPRRRACEKKRSATTRLELAHRSVAGSFAVLRAIVGSRCSWRLRNVEASSRFLQPPPRSKHACRWSAPRRQDPHMPATLASTASLRREDTGVTRDELQTGQVSAWVEGCRSCCGAPGWHHRCRAREGLGEAAAIPQNAGPIAAQEAVHLRLPCVHSEAGACALPSSAGRSEHCRVPPVSSS